MVPTAGATCRSRLAPGIGIASCGAAFAPMPRFPPGMSPDVYEFLEAEGYTHAIRLKANAVLQESIAHLLSRPVGRPPNLFAASIPTSAVRPAHGAGSAAWSPRSGGIRASCIRESGSMKPSVKKTKVAGARKLAVVPNRMWRDETDFQWSTKKATA